MTAKRQLTLGNWAGFTKRVKHNGKFTEVKVPTTVSEHYQKESSCMRHLQQQI